MRPESSREGMASNHDLPVLGTTRRSSRVRREAAASESTQQGVIERYEAQGYTGHFGARPGGQVKCFKCESTTDAENIHMHGLHRLEGASDPGDMMAIAAVECPGCGVKGTLTLSYGPAASGEDKAVLAALRDRRDDAKVTTGT
jgi:hypothetical protein